jgi:hypothetical protein
MSLFLGFRSAFLAPAALLRLALVSGCLVLGSLTSAPATAAESDDSEESGTADATSGSSDDNSEAEGSEADVSAEEASEEEEGDDKASNADDSVRPSSPPDAPGHDPVWEDPNERYMFVGARYRVQYVPLFLQNLFAEGGDSLWVQTPGVEFGLRKDGLETSIFAMLGMYSLESVPFKGKTDPELAWELVDANYKVLFLGADFMWTGPEFTQGLSLIYGAGIGIGVVFGDMNRTQAFPDAMSSSGYTRCSGVGDPRGFSPAGQYCDGANDHYDGYVEPSWADSGSSPLIFPWLGGQLGLRYKAHRRFVARLELGFTITSLFFGLGADYGL